jgi:hypothetical protein
MMDGGIDWEDITLTNYPPKPKPTVLVKETSDAMGTKWLILDSAKEPVDSTRRHERVGGLVEYWQEFLYGATWSAWPRTRPGSSLTERRK